MKFRPYLIGAAVGAALALLLGWFLWHAEPVHEGAAFEKPLPSGGVLIRRDPDAEVPVPVKRAAKEAGGKLERSISVTVQPRPIVESPLAGSGHQRDDALKTAPGTTVPGVPELCSCGPVTVDLGLVHMPDRTRRIVATSPDGEVIAGLDIPLESRSIAKPLRWAAGATYEPRRREFGAFLDRDLGPLRLGVEVQQRRDGVAAVLRAGIRF